MPGFEDELVGMSQGETKEFSLIAPTDYYHEALAGQNLDFTVTMKNVQKVELPSVDNAFAASLGKFPSLDALKESIRDGLRQEKEERARERRRLEIVEHLIKTSSVDVPSVLVQDELATMEREFEVSLERMRIEKESYLQHLGTTMEEMKKGWSEQAVKRVKAALILRAVAERESVHVPQEEVDERVAHMLQSVSSPEQAEGIDRTALRDHAHASLRNEKVFELLEKHIIEKK
jgi:trigger factor